jgi:hypothetical protein
MWTEIHVAVTMLAHEFWDLAQLITREEVVTPNADLFFGADTGRAAVPKVGLPTCRDGVVR